MALLAVHTSNLPLTPCSPGTWLPPRHPAGTPRIEVTFHVDERGVLNVSALDLNTQRHEQWLREGYLVARCNPNP